MAAWPQNSIGRRHFGSTEGRWLGTPPGVPRRGAPIMDATCSDESPAIVSAARIRGSVGACGASKAVSALFRTDSLRFVNEIGSSAWHRTACGLLHSRSAFVIRLPLTARDRRHLGCGCSSVVEHDLAKVGVEGSSPFARSRFFSYGKSPDHRQAAFWRPCRFWAAFTRRRRAAGRVPAEPHLFGMRTTRTLAVPVFTSRKRPGQNPLTGLFK